jgi:hypothetical protein
MVYVVQFTNDCSRFCCSWLFLLQILFIEDKTRTIDEMGGIRTQAPNLLRCFNTGIGCCITNYFNFVGEFRIV